MRIKHFAAIASVAKDVHDTGHPIMLFIVNDDDEVWMMADPNSDAEWFKLPELPLHVGEVRVTVPLERDYDRTAQREER